MKTVILLLTLIFSHHICFAQSECDKADEYAEKTANQMDGHTNSYAAQFYQFSCICKKGVLKADEQKVIAMINKNRELFIEMGGVPSDLSPSIITKCTIKTKEELDAQKNSSSPTVQSEYTSMEFAGNLTGLIKEIANQSKNPELKLLATNMDNSQKSFDEILEFANSISPLDNTSLRVIENIETITNVIIIADVILGKKRRANKELTDEQSKINQDMILLSQSLKLIHDNISKPPIIIEYNRSTLNDLKEQNKMMFAFEAATCKERLLLLKFFNSDLIIGNEKYAELKNEIENLFTQGGAPLIEEHIKEQIQIYRVSGIDYSPVLGDHIIHVSESFKIPIEMSFRSQAKCYSKMGDIKMYNEIISTINPGKTKDIGILMETFFLSLKEKDYRLSNDYFKPILTWLFNDFTYKEEYELINFNQVYYFDIHSSLTIDNWMETLLIGFDNSLKLEDKTFSNQIYYVINEIYLHQKKAEDNYDKAKAIKQVADILIGNDIESISNLRTLLDNSYGNQENGFKIYCMTQIAKLYSKIENYSRSNDLIREIKSELNSSYFHKQFVDNDQLRFIMAFNNYKLNKYQLSLKGLNALESKNPNDLSVQKMKILVYEKTQNIAEIELCHKKINKIINKNQ